MNWYLVKMVFQIVNGNNRAQFDEQLRLVKADEITWASEKASVLGWLEQTTFKSNQGEVEWRFIGVAEIQQVGGWEDGMQLWSTTSEMDNESEYINLVKTNSAKALYLNRYANYEWVE